MILEGKYIMETHVCPWYLGYLLANPLRRLFQNPEILLSPYLQAGMKVLEVGPGMGFFSLPMARMVGETGRIYCVDLQEKMLKSLQRRASNKNLLERIEVHRCSESSLQIGFLAGMIDFSLLFAVIHEVPNQEQLFLEIVPSLKQNGLLLIAEPRGHVTDEDFKRTLSHVQRNGMKLVDSPNINKSHTTLFKKI